MSKTFRDIRGATVGDPTGQPLRMIEGLEGVLSSNTAVAREIGNLSRELRIINQRGLQYGPSSVTASGAGGTDVVEALQQAIEAQTRTMLAALSGAPPSTPQAPPESDVPASGWLPAPPPFRGDRQVSPASTTQGHPLDTMRGALPETPSEEAAVDSREIYNRRKNYFKDPVKGKFTLANVRRSFGEGLSKRMDNHTFGEQLVEGPLGNLHHPSEVEGEIGDFASPAAVSAFHRREKISAAVRHGASALSEGATLRQSGMAMLPAGAAKAGGIAGAILYAGKALGDFATDQRAKNNEWIATQGGGGNDAVEERVRSKLFEWSNFGTLKGEDAAKLYKGVADTGMNRDQRGNAQDFAIQNYKEFGMGVDQSMEIIDFAAKHGQESLNGLARSLRAVTESAKDAGVNTEVARQTFVKNWKTFSETMGGPEATIVAGGFSAAQASMGREFQGLDFSGVGSPENLRLMASKAGMSGINELILATKQEGGEAAFGDMYASQQTEIIHGQIGDAGMDVIDRAFANRSDQDGRFTQDELDAIEEELLALPIPDVDVLARVLTAQGAPPGLDGDNVLPYIANQVSGIGNPGAYSEEQAAASKTYQIESKPEKTPPGGNAPIFTGQEIDPTRADALDELRDLAVADDGVGSAFVHDVDETGRRGGVSEAVATTQSGIDEVQVETTDGPRVVDLEDAMKYFRDQIDAGTAMVAGGEHSGRTVAEVMELKGDEEVDVTSDEDEDLDDKGDSLKDWDKDNKGGGDGGGGSVLIRPTDALMHWFEFVPEGNVELDPGAWREPPPSDVTPDGRASGSSR